MRYCTCLLNKEMAMVFRTLKKGRQSSFRIKQFLQVLKVAKEKKEFSLKEFQEAIGFSYSTTWVYLRMLRSLRVILPIVTKKYEVYTLDQQRVFEYKADKKLLKTIFFFILNNFHCPVMTDSETKIRLKKVLEQAVNDFQQLNKITFL